MTRNIEAYDAYLAGIALQARGTPESYLRATERFREAVALDPAFALAWLLLSGSLGGHAALTGGLIPPEAFVALMRAESLNPNDPRAKLLRAGLAIEAFEWRDIAREIQSLRETNPDEWYLDMFEGDFLRLVGRFDAAVVLYERAAIREPLDVGTADSVYEARYLAGDTAAATAAEKAAALRRAQGLPAPLTHDFRVAIQQRDVQRVEASIDSIIETDFTKLRLAAAMKPLLHDAAAAQAELRRLEPAADNVVDLSAIAVWWVYFSGDTDFVFDILARIDSFTSIGRGRALPVLIWNRTMSDLRRTPRFKDLAREIGLVDYWREFGWADDCRPVGSDDFECS
jgi:tetratricopeptide (TPR) repeat protein